MPCHKWTEKNQHLFGLYAIADTSMISDDRLIPVVQEILENGASILQYRDKKNNAAIRLQQAKKLKDLCEKFAVPFVINDDVDLAKAVGAGGVHLGQNDLSIASARNILGETAIIGITCHASIDFAIKAQASGADYIALGAFFPSKTKPDASRITLEAFQKIRSMIYLPIVAIGGIKLSNALAIIQSGANMIAVIDSLLHAEDVGEKTREFSDLFSS